MRWYYLFFLVLFFTNAGLAQDYIITWSGDTLSCVLPGKPGKEGIRPAAKYHNGHIRVVAFFPNDSVRVLEAGQVKGYFRSRHGKSLLCDGHFEAKKIYRKGRDTVWYFMNRVVEGKFASLYVVYLRADRRIYRYYYLRKLTDRLSFFESNIATYKQLRRMLTEDDIREGMQLFFSGKRKNRFIGAVREYNRLKEALGIANPD